MLFCRSKARIAISSFTLFGVIQKNRGVIHGFRYPEKLWSHAVILPVFVIVDLIGLDLVVGNTFQSRARLVIQKYIC